MMTDIENVPPYQKKKHRLEGVVVSDRMHKTVVVAVMRIKEHPKYKKRFRVVKKYQAHDEHDDYRVGDEVRIEETRPLSRQKQWVVVKRIGKREIREARGGIADDDASLDPKEEKGETQIPTS